MNGPFLVNKYLHQGWVEKAREANEQTDRGGGAHQRLIRVISGLRHKKCPIACPFKARVIRVVLDMVARHIDGLDLVSPGAD